MTVSSQEINDRLMEILRENKQQKIWIGYTYDAKVKGNWKWSNPSAHPNPFNAWAPGEPNTNGVSENCVEWILNWGNKWNDVNCGKKYRFVCEI